jgi:CRISPR-associated endonuclease/helicase Cas3
LLHFKENEEDFYKQFDGVKVLPQSFKSQFEDELKKYDFLNAEALKVQIRKQKFRQLLANKGLQKEVYAFGNNKNEQIEIPYFIINYKYDSRLGLLFDEQEVWDDSSVFL